MPKTKSMLKRYSVEVAKARRTCDHSGTAISKGQACLVIFDAPGDRHVYSALVTLKMIQDAREQLDRIEEALK